MAAAIMVLSSSFYIFSRSRPTRQVKMPTETGMGSHGSNYLQYSEGFFMAVEASGGYSLNINRPNFGYAELDVVGGYRFSEYLRAGIGLGGRYYANNVDARNTSSRWGLPLFLNLRGNFIPGEYRDVVPFWSADIGTTFPDGVMFRPSIGIRVGQERSAFILSVGYLGQSIRTYGNGEHADHPFYSFITMKLGYEF